MKDIFLPQFSGGSVPEHKAIEKKSSNHPSHGVLVVFTHSSTQAT